MAEITIRKTEKQDGCCKELVVEADHLSSVHENLIEHLLTDSLFKEEKKVRTGKTSGVDDRLEYPKEVEHDIVAIYDNEGIPSIMHRFRKVTN